MRLSGLRLEKHAPNVGMYVWGYRLTVSNFLYTVTKTLEPTKMLIRSSKENTSNKKIPYGNNHAVCVSKTGRVLKSKVYALTKEDLCCYLDKDECIEAFKKTALYVIKEVKALKQEKIDWYDNHIINLKKYEDYDE